MNLFIKVHTDIHIMKVNLKCAFSAFTTKPSAESKEHYLERFLFIHVNYRSPMSSETAFKMRPLTKCIRHRRWSSFIPDWAADSLRRKSPPPPFLQVKISSLVLSQLEIRLCLSPSFFFTVKSRHECKIYGLLNWEMALYSLHPWRDTIIFHTLHTGGGVTKKKRYENTRQGGETHTHTTT